MSATFVICPDTDENRSMLAVWGGMTNRLKQKAMTFPSKVRLMHRQAYAELEPLGITNPTDTQGVSSL